MGTVYAAYDTSLEIEVAIKVGRLGASSIEGQRFLREARMMASLEHPNIVRVFNLGELPGGRPYMVMELLRGKTFYDLLKEGPLDLSRILDRLWEIASALDWIHHHRVIHRDLKLDNLMLVRRNDGTEVAKLFDFGIALEKNRTTVRLTQDGSIVGTPLYIPPEMVETDDVSPRTDIYAFGVVIYQLLGGAAPFEAPSPIELLRKKTLYDPIPLSRHRDDLPAGVEEAVNRALARKPHDRPKSATELVRLLASTQDEPVKRRESRALAVAGSVAFLLAALIGGYATLSHRTELRPAIEQATTIAIAHNGN
jgi:serine/threonine-protein kinase